MALGGFFRKINLLLSIGARVTKGRNVKFSRTLLRARPGDEITIGDNCVVAASVRTDRSPATITIGSRTQIGAKGLIVAAQEVSIGEDVLISWGVTIVDHNSHSLDWEHRRFDAETWLQGEKDWTHVAIKPVRIGNKAWIGFGASILKGVNIGEGAIIGACAVVTKDVEPWTTVGGNPARVIGPAPSWPR